MDSDLTSVQMRYIVEKLLYNAADMKEDANEDAGKHKGFYDGMRYAYRDLLDTMKAQNIVDDEELKKYGLNRI